MKVKTYARTTSEENQRERDNRELARRIAEEGIVLLKNDGALPVAPGNIALYGAGVVKTIYGGTGSGEVNARKYVSVLEGFENAGYQVTSRRWLQDYEADFVAEEEAFVQRMKSGFLNIRNGADANNILGQSFIYPAGRAVTEADVAESNTDTCVYVIARQSGEGSDRRPEDFVFLPEEIKQVEFCASHYEKTILVINVGSSMDLTGIDTIEGLDAIVYMCQLGEESGTALANVISGKVSPSGHLTDTWVQNYKQVPFGDQFSFMSTPDPLQQDYKEGIFVGYRYYQTAGVEPRYPFGYGLSYTTFSYEVKSTELFRSYVTTKVKVTNTGDTYEGKAVVQGYLSLPSVKFQKPYQQLVAYAKTPVLGPGQTSEVELRFDLRDETTYDESTTSYILEAGDYILMVGDSSATTEPAAVITLAETVTVENAKAIDGKPSFQDMKLSAKRPDVSDSVPRLTMEPKDIHPITHTFQPEQKWSVYRDLIANMSLKDGVDLVLGMGMHFFAFKGAFTVPGNAANTTTKLIKSQLVPTVSLADGPAGLRILEESVQYPYGTIKPLKNAISIFDYLPGTLSKLLLGNKKFGKTLYQYATAFPVGTAVAQTFNVDLAEAFGAAVSAEMSEYGVTFWLAPGMNIHRNPLCGRNFEYYSEDPMMTGSIAAAVCRGVASRPGNYVTIKHFAANNQEFQRNKASSNVSERAFREVYLRPFKRAIRDGSAKAVMTSYNPVNGIYNVENKSLLEDYLRGECGFDGVVMTDWTSTTPGLASPVKAIQAGNDLLMPGMITDRVPLLIALKKGELNARDLRRCAERVLKLVMESEQGKIQLKEMKKR